MPFSYYQRLSRRKQAIYRKSDQVGRLVVPEPKAFAGPLAALAKVLEAEGDPAAQRTRARGAVEDLCRELCRQFGVENVEVKVLARRPHNAGGELHALYTMESGGRAHINIWMHTAKQKRVVAFKTFLRTLLHEFCHHLDFKLFSLEESFHTQGFFRRESSLVAQLLDTRPEPVPDRPGEEPRPALSAERPAAVPRRRREKLAPKKPVQIDLPF